MPNHSTLTGDELHNPKGFDTANNDTVLKKNSSGSLEWQEVSYAEMDISDNSTPFTPAAVSTYEKLTNTNWTENLSHNITVDTANSQVTILDGGTYHVSFWCSLESSAATGTAFAIKYALNDTVGTRKLKVQKNSTGDDVIVMSAQGLVSASANDILSIYISSSATDQLTITDAGLIVKRIN